MSRGFVLALALIGCADAPPPHEPSSTATEPNALPLDPEAPVGPPASVAPRDGAHPAAPAPIATSAPAATSPLLDLEAIGCFAWSEREQTAACIASRSSIAEGCHESLVFVGAKAARHRVLEVPPQCLGEQPAALGEAERAAVEARVAASYARLGEPAATLGPGERADVGAATVELVRRTVGHVALIDGAWDVYSDEVFVRCGKKRVSVARARVENALAPSVTVVDTGGPWILLWYAATWGFEGDMGGRTDVVAVDRSRCTVVTAPGM